MKSQKFANLFFCFKKCWLQRTENLHSLSQYYFLQIWIMKILLSRKIKNQSIPPQQQEQHRLFHGLSSAADKNSGEKSQNRQGEAAAIACVLRRDSPSFPF